MNLQRRGVVFQRREALAGVISALLLTTASAGCATNPATGKRQISLIGEQQEIQMGREADQEIVASMGLYPDDQLQAYAQRLGAQMAVDTERPNLPWTFRVVNDSTVNAFALPGGYIYVTRGILTYVNSEAELASVLGHEIGHVTARHTVNRISKAQLATLGLGLGMILKPQLRNYGDLAQVGLGLLFLKYSRDDERQADDLGLRYLTRQGYDPREMTEVFATLDRLSAAQGSGRIPNWLSTHPDPGDRSARIAEQIRALPVAQQGEVKNRDGYLRRIDGIVFGEDPREGFFQQNVFYHPQLRFRFAFPRGWKTSNQKQAVGAISPNQDAIVVITLANRDSPEAAAREFFSQRGIQEGRPWRGDINGLRAVANNFAALTDQGELLGIAAFVDHGGKVYQILGYTPASRWPRYDNVLTDAINTFERLTDRRYLSVQPKRVEVQRVPRDMSLREFDERYPSTVSLPTLALINHVEEGEELQAGMSVKRVVGGELP